MLVISDAPAVRIGIDAGTLDRRIAIQHRVKTSHPDYGTPIVQWETFLEAWAEVQDILPSRAEQVADGISIARRPCRIRMHYRPGITSDMRVKYGSRTLQIVAGPAEIGRREGIELVAEELSTEGTAP